MKNYNDEYVTLSSGVYITNRFTKPIPMRNGLKYEQSIEITIYWEAYAISLWVIFNLHWRSNTHWEENGTRWRRNTMKTEHDEDETRRRRNTMKTEHDEDGTRWRQNTMKTKHDEDRTRWRRNTMKTEHDEDGTRWRRNTMKTEHDEDKTRWRQNTMKTEHDEDRTRWRRNTMTNQTRWRQNTMKTEHDEDKTQRGRNTMKTERDDEPNTMKLELVDSARHGHLTQQLAPAKQLAIDEKRSYLLPHENFIIPLPNQDLSICFHLRPSQMHYTHQKPCHFPLRENDFELYGVHYKNGESGM